MVPPFDQSTAGEDILVLNRRADRKRVYLNNFVSVSIGLSSFTNPEIPSYLENREIETKLSQGKTSLPGPDLLACTNSLISPLP